MSWISKAKPHGKSLLTGRVSIPGQIYAITSVTHSREKLFSDIHLARIVVNAMRFHHEKGTVKSLAFVVMPDHFHWMLSLTDKIDLARLRAIPHGKSSALSAMAITNQYDRKGILTMPCAEMKM